MIRGLWTHAGTLYAVIDNKLKAISGTGVTLVKGTLNSVGGPIDFASNLTQMVINDGSYLYAYTPSSNTFTVVSGYTGGDRISFLDQRINFQFRGLQQFGWTAVGDATSIDPLDFASAEGSPDLLVSHVAFNRELWLMGEDSTEIWDPSTATDLAGSPVVYERSSAAIDYGCAAAFTAQKSANSVFWLGKDARGQAMVLQGQGHQVKRISTRAQEEQFAGKSLGSASAFCYSDGGQSFYCLNVPGVNTTLVWDETFGQWHERAEWNGGYSQWRPTCHAFAYGRHYFGCGTDIYTLDSSVHKYGSDVKRRQRTAPVISKPGMGRIKYPSFEILCEKGTGAQVLMRYSDDNGYTWSNQHYANVGTTGQFAKRARFRRLGMAYDRVFEVTFDADAPFNPVAVNVPL